MSNWQPIGTAPRNGTVIEITALDSSGEPFEIHPMQWGHIMQNPLFAPGQVGMWVSPSGEYTWREGLGGPTHWRPTILGSKKGLHHEISEKTSCD